MRYFVKIRDFVRLHGFSHFRYWFFLILRQLFCLLMAILMFVSLMLLMLGLFYRVARAEVVSENYHYDGVVWGISDVEYVGSGNALNPKQGCIVNAPNAFSAACYAVGGNPSDLTAAQRAVLSNSASGGDFYTFSQRFVNYGGSFDLPDWFYVNFYDLWSKYESLYGDALYAADFTQAQLSGARADYQTILNGGSLGGSTTEIKPPAGDYYLFDLDDTNYASYGTFAPTNKTRYVLYQKSMIDDFVSGMSAQISGYSPYFHVTKHGNVLNIEISMFRGLVIDGPVNYRFRVTGQGYMIGYDSSTGAQGLEGYVGNYQGDSTGFYFLYGNVSRQYWIYNTASFYFDFYPTYILRPLSDARVVTYDGNGNWPDNPTVVAPEPPELPDPYNPIIDEQPIDPTPPQNPIYPPILNITEDIYTADLQGILDAMDAHCQHLRSALHTEMSNFWTAISTKMTNDFATFRTYMTGQIGWLGDLISDEMEATRDYLQDLFEWLAEQFEYTFTGTAYDDNTLISWLRKIYYRLGSGGVNTRPVDPVSNPIDAGDWLSQLIANLFTALNALAGGLLTSVGSALDLMRTKFPFSLPWDLLAILALFEAPPAAPDFDVPIYTLSSVGQLVQVGSWEIDLSDLSPYLEGIRWMQKICFVYFLAVHTKDWMDTLEKVVA